MNVRQMRDLLGLETAAGQEGLDREVSGGYCGDLLSDVMANAARGDAWFTMQSHQNIVAVAVLRELAAIVLVNGRRPDEDTVERADEEGIPILLSGSRAYELAGRLFAAGIGKKTE
ncbi:MAG: serine kinase [Deltaproteobacteria bacterium]|nr:MAG: serine kinase [Deltaproteobacteria bacterium]